MLKTSWRKTEQHLLPAQKPQHTSGYDIYPAFQIPAGKINNGFDRLTEALKDEEIILLDGFNGVFFEEFADKLKAGLMEKGRRCQTVDIKSAMKAFDEIDQLIEPFLGGDDPLFGSRSTLELIDFFDHGKLRKIGEKSADNVLIVYGAGAALTHLDGRLIYIDLPKNEQQFRMRAGSITNLGAEKSADIKSMYKRAYFVDWPVLNNHKRELLPQTDYFVDGQRPLEPAWIKAIDLQNAFQEMSGSVFRVRPWFEPGAWGGQWIKNKIQGLNKNVVNYAWSFELIVPENGILLQSEENLLEISFDSLMFMNGAAVMGEHYELYGPDFPIRFDFLDTFDGGNLSIQCHPRPSYIRKYFGERFTQEETYYILDSGDDAVVYLGFQDNIMPSEFETALKESFSKKEELEIEQFVQKHPAQNHDLFLIPPGTIHASGKNNLVLEISTTPYIFTFKMYDWLRLDLDGKARPLNISRGMENLYFERCGDYVKENLLSKPVLIESGSDWQCFSLPTHENHTYMVERFHFSSSITLSTNNKVLVMSLVEGITISVETFNGIRTLFNYAETFVVPAAAKSVTITNLAEKEAKLVVAFMKNPSIIKEIWNKD
ncbi:MAG: class I mannose-6-phosphate isomerase [Calditrichaeota bacterium]|nr:class I mannose-6-phosphate isomerase [Calditrichota bacterium]